MNNSYFLQRSEQRVEHYRKLKSEFPGLSPRAIYILVDNDINTRAEGKNINWLKLRRCGPKTAIELTAWAKGIISYRKGHVIKIVAV